ncbi:Uncharacterized protein BC067498_02148 [Bacillus cereus]|nr:Uncharacterized protein BC067498_02148 [Bacillus cereus]
MSGFLHTIKYACPVKRLNKIVILEKGRMNKERIETVEELLEDMKECSLNGTSLKVILISYLH